MDMVTNGSWSEDQVKSLYTIPVHCGMTETCASLGVSEGEFAAMRDALRTQQQLLRKIYFELDEEREAAASAASEALSMIRRLQGEKAMVKLESDQYKRLAEEKMFHAEECLANLEDLMYLKEMEIASLEYQIQAYRCKLVSMGCGDPIVNKNRLSGNLVMHRNSILNGIMRGNSLPPNGLDSYYTAIERERCAVAVADSILRIAEDKKERVFSGGGHSLDATNEKLEKAVSLGFSNPYPEQMKKLDELVTALLEGKPSETEENKSSGNINDAESSVSFSLQAKSSLAGDIRDHESKHSESILDCGASVTSSSSLSVSDIFEVSQVFENGYRSQRGEQCRLREGENRLEKPSFSLEESVDLNPQAEIDEMKKPLSFHNNCLCEASDRASAVDSHLALLHRPSTSVAQSTMTDFLNLSRRVEELEKDRVASMRDEIKSEENDQVKLLNKIQEQLNSIQSEIRGWKRPSKPVRSEESALLPLQEALLHFWL